MEKIIHYCWFGGKHLTKTAKKCIKSWRKFFPEYTIKEWNEKNFDINMCPFVKEAYKEKKWAFVSDYARLYALYNEGGIYFDTDMEVVKKCDFLCKDEMFLGYEENRVIAVGVLGVKHPNNEYIKQLLEWYNNQECFDINNIFNYSIPKIVTNILAKYNIEEQNGVDIINNEIKIYPEEYFYPINYNYSKKSFTNNTCMIHYYNATWVSKEEKIAIWVLRTFGKTFGNILLKTYYKLCKIKNYIIGFIKRRLLWIKTKYSIHFKYKKRVEHIKKIIEKNNNNYIMIYHPDWIGLSNVAKDNFKSLLPLKEQYTQKEAYGIANEIYKKGFKLVIFNGFADGWELIIYSLRNLNPDIKIKVLWHGSNALLTEEYDYKAFMKLLNMNKNKVIDEIGFVKKSMYEFYIKKGYNCSFVMNYIEIKNKDKFINKANLTNKMKVGLYCSGNRWVKNVYNQISAVSLIDGAILDCIPLSFNIREFANSIDLDITGFEKNLSREELFSRILQNDVNLYVTFTECAPLLPLESLELGIPCITGDNHHYFEGTELEKYLVVDKEDNIMEIYKKIIFARENKELILKLYSEWKTKYNTEAKKSLVNFINI